MGDEDQEELALSKDKGLRPDPPAFTGLFRTDYLSPSFTRPKNGPYGRGDNFCSKNLLQNKR